MLITFREYESKPRAELGDRHCKQLQALDERLAAASGDTVFDWGRLKYIRAKNYVGVLSDGDISVEILPKTDVGTGAAKRDAAARQNLLHMMATAGRLPVRDRDLADLRTEKLPIYDALIQLFVDRLLRELRRGLDHHYVLREENSGFVRGKLVLPLHIKENSAHRERVYVAYDEFLPDTWLNRVLKAACRKLVRQTGRPLIQRSLKEALLMFADVADVPIRRHHLGQIRITRESERFAGVYAFSKLVLFDGSPAPTTGPTQSFSILVPMDILFEEYIGHVIRRYAPDLGFGRGQVKLQAKGKAKHLLKKRGVGPVYKLKPDVLITGDNEPFQRILDTKWKRLDKSKRPGQSDMYQLYAYATRYKAPLSILLYPKMPGLSPCDYKLDGEDHHRQVRVAFVDMNRDLRKERAQLVAELRQVLAM